MLGRMRLSLGMAFSDACHEPAGCCADGAGAGRKGCGVRLRIIQCDCACFHRFRSHARGGIGMHRANVPNRMIGGSRLAVVQV